MKKATKLAVALAVSLVLPPGVAMADQGPPIYLPQTAPFGKPLPQWTAEWWQFMLSIPTAVNPLADETGDRCMLGQRGEVWFLAGNFGGTAAPTTRACSIPEGKALFFPVLNVVDVNTTTQTASELRTETAPCLDAATRSRLKSTASRYRGFSTRIGYVPLSLRSHCRRTTCSGLTQESTRPRSTTATT